MPQRFLSCDGRLEPYAPRPTDQNAGRGTRGSAIAVARTIRGDVSRGGQGNAADEYRDMPDRCLVASRACGVLGNRDPSLATTVDRMAERRSTAAVLYRLCWRDKD